MTATTAGRNHARTRGWLLCAIAALVFAIFLWPATTPASAGGGGCAHKRMKPGHGKRIAAARAVKCLVNHKRRARGIPGVRGRIKLRTPARGHSGYMVRHRCFSHQCYGELDMMGRIRKDGYFSGAKSYGCGENIASNSYRFGTPRAIVRSWMRSAAHRDVLLARGYNHIGVGVVWGSPYGDSGAGTYTADFCYRNG